MQVVAGDETAYPSLAGIIEPHVFPEATAGAVPHLPEVDRGSLRVVERAGRRAGDALLDGGRPRG